MRDTERQRHRQREKQAPRREPDVDSIPGPRITPWAEGRRSTTEPPRCSISFVLIGDGSGFSGHCISFHVNFRIVTLQNNKKNSLRMFLWAWVESVD